MSYHNFVNSLSNAFNIFVDGISEVANSLMNNYIFITLLGLVLFISLFYIIYYFILDYIYKKSDDIEEEIDLYKRYKRHQLIKLKFLHKDRPIAYDLKYINYMINQGMIREYISKHYYDYKNLKLVNYQINQDVKRDYLRNQKGQYIIDKYNEYNTNFKAVGLALKNRKIKIGFDKPVPKWFGKEYELNKPTEQESKEIKDIIDNF